MQQNFDSFSDGDGNVIIVTTCFNENGDIETVYNCVPLSRATQIHLLLGQSIGFDMLKTIQDIKKIDIEHKIKNGSFLLPQNIRQDIEGIVYFFEQAGNSH
jgi:hypothetical protein